MFDVGGGASVWRIPGRIPGTRANLHMNRATATRSFEEKILRKLFIILISVCFFGCSDDSSVIEHPIVGIWATSCNYNSLDFTQTQLTINHYEIYSDKTLHYEEYSYEGDPCSSDDYSMFSLDATYSIGETVTTNTGETATVLNITECPIDPESCETYQRIFIIKNDTLIFGFSYDGEYILNPEIEYQRIDYTEETNATGPGYSYQ